MAQVDEAPAYDNPESFALRVKYDKHTLFIPVEPSTSYETVLTRSISILIKSNAFPPEESGYSSFESMEADDAALFIGSTKAVGGVDQDILRFTEVDRAKENTVSRMGFKDGPDAVAYLGFRAKGAKGEYQQPVVKIPSLVEEEDEEEDSDAIPPPYDGDDLMTDVSKGKGKA